MLTAKQQNLIDGILDSVRRTTGNIAVPDTWGRTEMNWLVSDIVDMHIRKHGHTTTYKNKLSQQYKDYRFLIRKEL